MDEDIVLILKRLGDHLHWMGHWQEANLVIDLAVILECRQISKIEEVQRWRKQEEIIEPKPVPPPAGEKQL